MKKERKEDWKEGREMERRKEVQEKMEGRKEDEKEGRKGKEGR